jgi:bifunctional ADP-heptose synthase (sugar kinase/adenylyltransferase)
VDVQVEDALTGGLPDVYAYVVAVGAVGGFHGLAGQDKGGQEFGLFLRGGVEPG